MKGITFLISTIAKERNGLCPENWLKDKQTEVWFASRDAELSRPVQLELQS